MRKNRNKYERIQFVRDLGFNTEENILIKPTDLSNNYRKFLNDLEKCSLRSFREEFEDFNSPAHPILTKKEAYSIIPKIRKQGYNIILAKPIDPKDCLFAGAVYKTSKNIVTEIADGPGTVRRVTRDGKIDRSYSAYETDDKKLNKCLAEFKNCHLENVIFEFSYYKIPVGYKKQNFIVWEITDDGSNNSRV